MALVLTVVGGGPEHAWFEFQVGAKGGVGFCNSSPKCGAQGDRGNGS